MPKKKPRVDGEHILYHYLQKDLRQSDVWLFQMLVSRLMAELGIWLHPDIYQALPIVLPFAVRDPTCRKRKKGDTEAWGSPNAKGYFRDDNSLIKSIPNTLPIRSNRQLLYINKYLGKGFTACHVWGGVRNPLTYSFVPNLVWLPRQVAKLSDREGSFSQLYLQAIALKIYRNLPVQGDLRPFVDDAWAHLAEPRGIPELGLPEVSALNFFAPTERFLPTRIRRIEAVVQGLGQVLDGQPLDGIDLSSRYREGLPKLDRHAAGALNEKLKCYLGAVADSTPLAVES